MRRARARSASARQAGISSGSSAPFANGCSHFQPSGNERSKHTPPAGSSLNLPSPSSSRPSRTSLYRGASPGPAGVRKRGSDARTHGPSGSSMSMSRIRPSPSRSSGPSSSTAPSPSSSSGVRSRPSPPRPACICASASGDAQGTATKATSRGRRAGCASSIEQEASTASEPESDTPSRPPSRSTVGRCASGILPGAPNASAGTGSPVPVAGRSTASTSVRSGRADAIQPFTSAATSPSVW